MHAIVNCVSNAMVDFVMLKLLDGAIDVSMDGATDYLTDGAIGALVGEALDVVLDSCIGVLHDGARVRCSSNSSVSFTRIESFHRITWILRSTYSNPCRKYAQQQSCEWPFRRWLHGNLMNNARHAVERNP